MKMIDMFAGMGNMRIGFEQAGHECAYSIEFDKHKREIYKVIFGREPDAGDITNVRGTDLPEAECWCFGAPCQDFSVAGKRAGLDGDRSSLVREVFRLLTEKAPDNRPEWLLYENVKGMLSSNNGWDFAAIQAEMGQCGYDVQWQLLNSKDFGVPQNRERVYTIGHLRAKGRRKVFPIGIPNERSNIIIYGYTKCAKVKDRTRILSVNGVCQCLRSTDYKDPPKISVASGAVRRISPRESLRLQGVPDYITDKLIAAGISDTQMYRAAGDACTVNVIYEIARRLA